MSEDRHQPRKLDDSESDHGAGAERGSDESSRQEGGRVSRLPFERRIEQRLTVLPLRLPNKERRRDGEVGKAFPGQRRARSRAYGTYISFVLAVVLPTIVASVYYLWFASNQYVAEFRFAVSDTTPSSMSSIGTNLASLFTGGASNSPLENYMVADYLTSRQVAEELDRRIHVRSLYSKPGIDWWARFDPTAPMEKFVTYWQKMVSANYDPITGIATAQVRAFSPEDAFLVGNSMVQLSEELINRIANRSNTDAVRFAEKEVAQAQDRLKKARVEMTAYRNKVGVIDPTTSVVATNSTVQQTLQGNLATLETQLTSLLGRRLAPNSPAVQALENQIKATKEQLAAVEATVAAGKDRAGGAALSSVIAEYEQLDLERQFAQALVTSAMQGLEQARATAASQHLYITPYVRPSLPESSVYPRRFLSVVIFGLLAFTAWLFGLLILRSIRERFG